jgi:hypothetical protein
LVSPVCGAFSGRCLGCFDERKVHVGLRDVVEVVGEDVERDGRDDLGDLAVAQAFAKCRMAFSRSSSERPARLAESSPAGMPSMPPNAVWAEAQ